MSNNSLLFEKSKSVIPSGVNSPVRAFGAVDGTPHFIERGKGPLIWDLDGNCFIDYVCSWGPLILGHADEDVSLAIAKAARNGSSFGAPTEQEFEMAHRLVDSFRSLEKVRLVSSGTEATMSAVRVARGFTGRKKIVKFEGCYHGHVDSLLVKAGSGALTFGQPSSAGVPAEATADTLVLSYGNFEELEESFKKYGTELAAVIIEPVAGNMNLIKPPAGYLKFVRELCDKVGAILIFDEVMTGFRVGPEGAQGLFNVLPDLTTLGKVIGGGLPMGAFGGRADIMDHLSPAGPVYQAGTLSGNPVAVAAGLATLKKLSKPGFFDSISQFTRQLVDGIKEAGGKVGVDVSSQAIGSMFGLYFSADVPQNFSDAIKVNQKYFKMFFHEMLNEGVYLAPSPFEAGFTSITHGDAELSKSISAAERAFLRVVSTEDLR